MSESEVLDKPKILPDEKVKTPRLYAAVVHNDDFTPRGFVVEALAKCFNKNDAEAAKIMMRAHQSGHAVVATYTFEVAETKVALANRFASENGKVLLFSVEPT